MLRYLWYYVRWSNRWNGEGLTVFYIYIYILLFLGGGACEGGCHVVCIFK
jgi:hypothetical protein